MFAYVRYEDKHKAVLPTTLIKRFTPGDVDDFDHEKSKMVFWVDEDGSQAGYYKAKVVMLGETEDLLLRSMIKQRIAIPRIIHDNREGQPMEDCQSTSSRTAQTDHGEKTTSKKRRIEERHSDGLQGTVPIALYEAQRAKVKALKQEVKRLRLELDEERSLSRSIQTIFLSRLRAESSSAVSAPAAPGCFSGRHPLPLEQPVPKEPQGAVRECPLSLHEASVLDYDVSSPEELCLEPPAAKVSAVVPLKRTPLREPDQILTPRQAIEEVQPSASAQLMLPPPPPVPVATGNPDQVDLGSGVSMTTAQFNHCADKSDTDSKFVRNACLAMWTEEELLARSVTGNRSRRFLNQGPEEDSKLPMTPKKLEAVRVAFGFFIGEGPEEVVKKRMAKMNSYVATYLQDKRSRVKKELKKRAAAAAAMAAVQAPTKELVVAALPA
uniref:Putative dna polymerase iii subunit gamma and tau n=1 Tax=Ixodes ricinus TaxID=34613 RepID=A0A6B0VDR3_IXORI